MCYNSYREFDLNCSAAKLNTGSSSFLFYLKTIPQNYEEKNGKVPFFALQILSLLNQRF